MTSILKQLSLLLWAFPFFVCPSWIVLISLKHPEIILLHQYYNCSLLSLQRIYLQKGGVKSSCTIEWGGELEYFTSVLQIVYQTNSLNHLDQYQDQFLTQQARNNLTFYFQKQIRDFNKTLISWKAWKSQQNSRSSRVLVAEKWEG